MKTLQHRFFFSLLALAVIVAASASTSQAGTLYLQSNGRLTPSSPVNSTRFYLSEQNQLEWSYPVRGGLIGSQYGYSIYAESNVQGAVSAAVEILLRRGGGETVLAQWPRGLWNTRGIQRFSGSFGGRQPDAQDGDVLVVRISMNSPTPYHQYGAVWVSRQYPSSITSPDFGTLTSADMQKVRDELSTGQSQLDQVLQQQAETQRQLQQLSSTVQRLEFMMQDLSDVVAKQNKQAEPEASQAAPPAVVYARMRFVPSSLELPAQAGQTFSCYLTLEAPRDVSEIDAESIRLNGTVGSLKPDPNLCPSADQNAENIGQGTDFQACLPVKELGKIFPKEAGRTLFSTLELSGALKDGTPLRGRGVIQITRTAQ